MNKIKNVGVAVITKINNEYYLLFVIEKNNKLNIPAGKIDGHSARKSAFRELKEETLLIPFNISENEIEKKINKSSYVIIDDTKIYFINDNNLNIVSNNKFNIIKKNILKLLKNNVKNIHAYDETKGIIYISIKQLLNKKKISKYNFRECCKKMLKNDKFRKKLTKCSF